MYDKMFRKPKGGPDMRTRVYYSLIPRYLSTLNLSLRISVVDFLFPSGFYHPMHIIKHDSENIPTIFPVHLF
jgi:hypothetical protein